MGTLRGKDENTGGGKGQDQGGKADGAGEEPKEMGRSVEGGKDRDRRCRR